MEKKIELRVQGAAKGTIRIGSRTRRWSRGVKEKKQEP